VSSEVIPVLPLEARVAKKGGSMVGILSYGAYIPMWRMDRGEIARATGTISAGGESAVASWDEDSLSMAVER